MTFFNKKEEVLDLQLTQYGKQLLSLGKFKPVYYNFFDNNILYDTKYSDIENENITSIESRIQDETPYCKTQYVFSSRETAMKSYIETNRKRIASEPDSAVLSFANPAETAYTQTLPLGNAEIGNQEAPVYSVVFLNGELSGSIVTAYSSSYSRQKIPQLNATIKFKIKPINIEDVGVPTTKTKYQNGFAETETVFQVTEEYLLLQITEQNAEFEKENFEIIPYLVETISDNGISNAIDSSYEQLTPLPFEKTMYQNEDGTITINNLQTPEFLEHYFTVLVDEEIPEELICESVERIKRLDDLLDNDFNCEDVANNLTPVNIYQSNITDDDIEKCEVSI
jgi:hypothetical protein